MWLKLMGLMMMMNHDDEVDECHFDFVYLPKTTSQLVVSDRQDADGWKVK